MEGCLMFQWGIVFQMGEASFLSGGGGGAPRGASLLMGEFGKNCWMGGTPHPIPPLWETLSSISMYSNFLQIASSKRSLIYNRKSLGPRMDP